MKVRVRDLSTMRIRQKAIVDMEEAKDALWPEPEVLASVEDHISKYEPGKNHRLSRVGY